MTVREYIGARYIPLFMGEWDSANAYEPLSVVSYQGNSYTSRQSVPVGVEITNTDFWYVSGNYNAQVEAYRREVRSVSDALPVDAFDSTNTVDARFNTLEGNVSGITTRVGNLETLTEKTKMVVIGDSFSDPDDPSATSIMWYDVVSTALNLTVHNYAKGGTGYIVGTDTCYSQISKAANDLDADEVSKVFIFSGINDVHNMGNTPQTFMSAANTAIKHACDSFPTSEIIVMGVCPTRNADAAGNEASGSWGFHRYDVFTEYLGLAARKTNANGAIKFINMRNFPWFIDGFFQSENNWHPSAGGQQAIASKVLGGDCGRDVVGLGTMYLTHKPIVKTKDGVAHEANSIDVSIVSNNLVSIGCTWSGLDLTAEGSAQPCIDLMGFPSGPRYILLDGQTANFSRYLAAGDTQYTLASKVYNIPNSIMTSGATSLSIMYYVTV